LLAGGATYTLLYRIVVKLFLMFEMDIVTKFLISYMSVGVDLAQSSVFPSPSKFHVCYAS
jgi:hypothetical protein